MLCLTWGKKRCLTHMTLEGRERDCGELGEALNGVECIQERNGEKGDAIRYLMAETGQICQDNNILISVSALQDPLPRRTC